MITTTPSSPPQSHYVKHMRSVKRNRDKKKLQKKDTRCVEFFCLAKRSRSSCKGFCCFRRLSKKQQQTPGSPDRSKWKKTSHLTPKQSIQREIDLSCRQMSKLSLDDGDSDSQPVCGAVSIGNGQSQITESPMLTPRLARSRSSNHRTNR